MNVIRKMIIQMEKRTSNNRTIAIIILLFIIVIPSIYFIFFNEKSDNPTSAKVEEQTGKRFEGYDDFYHATGGKWNLETTVYLLKEQKFVGSENELQKFLIYQAEPGETVRMKESKGRWKFLEVIKNDSVVAKGWADVDKCKAEKIK